jgi:4a-hydroxytetrahydrobiopterin dehydratase
MPDRAPLSDDALADALAALPAWQRDGDAITRTVVLGDFREALAFLVRVGFEAEHLNHHPEITNVYNRVRLLLRTHDAGNRVTDLDIALARRIDALLPDAAAADGA